MKNLFRSLRKHREQEETEKEVVERRLKKYTTKPLPKLPKKEEKEK